MKKPCTPKTHPIITMWEFIQILPWIRFFIFSKPSHSSPYPLSFILFNRSLLSSSITPLLIHLLVKIISLSLTVSWDFLDAKAWNLNVFTPDMSSCTCSLYDSSHKACGASHLSGAACVCGSTCSSDAQNHYAMDSQLLVTRTIIRKSGLQSFKSHLLHKLNAHS